MGRIGGPGQWRNGRSQSGRTDKASATRAMAGSTDDAIVPFTLPPRGSQ